MSQLLLQVGIVLAFGAFCFGCGYLTAFIVTRNQWRDEMIKRGVAHYNWQTGKWEWGLTVVYCVWIDEDHEVQRAPFPADADECQSVNGTGHFPGQGRGMHALFGCTLFEGGCTL